VHATKIKELHLMGQRGICEWSFCDQPMNSHRRKFHRIRSPVCCSCCWKTHCDSGSGGEKKPGVDGFVKRGHADERLAYRRFPSDAGARRSVPR
jgi:hypothetical protein